VNRDSNPIKPYFSKKDPYNALSETIQELDQNNLIKPTARSNLANLELKFTQEEFYQFIDHRKIGLSQKSHDWINRAAYTTWKHTHGTISREVLTVFRDFILSKYSNRDSYIKSVGLLRSFLKYLTKTRMDIRFAAFDIFLEPPKIKKDRKMITSRVVTIEDIKHVLEVIDEAESKGELDHDRALHHRTFILMGAYTGQRPGSTLAKITVGQVREALDSDNPCIHVLPSQDKIRMEHWVPLHPELIRSLDAIIDVRSNDELIFNFNLIQLWLKRNPIEMTRCIGRFTSSDLRKFAEQYGDIIQWDYSNRAYILTHGVSGVDWAHYKHPLPEYVYEIYMKYLGNVNFST
jgi:integrase